jgi:glycosyltransferase involved in cell wall biosynthesis
MISLVIRTLNEAKELRLLLEDLKKQVGPVINNVRQPSFWDSLEIIVVDNESTDDTQAVAEAYGCKVVTLPRAEFTYPKSINLGISAASHEVVILVVGHVRLLRTDSLLVAAKAFEDRQVAGLYSPVIPLGNSSLVEKLFYYPGYLFARLRGPFQVGMKAMGVMGATNCVIRRSLWEKHPFDETYEAGGDDGEWANWVREQGFTIICDWRFSVRHSHQLDFAGLKEQIAYWSDLAKPSKFDLPRIKSFRKDMNFD